MTNKQRILILSCGTNSGYHVGKVLKQKFFDDFYVYGADVNHRHLVPTFYLDKFFKVPYSSEPNYEQTILSICEENNVDYLLPVLDSDHLIFHQSHEGMKKINVKSLGITQECVNFYSDKEKTYGFLVANGLPCPTMYRNSGIDKLATYFVKPKNGYGSAGANARNGYSLLDENAEGFIVQELCREPEVTLEIGRAHV